MPGVRWDIYWWHYLDSYLYLHYFRVWLLLINCLQVLINCEMDRKSYNAISSNNSLYTFYLFSPNTLHPTPYTLLLILITHPVIRSSSHPSWLSTLLFSSLHSTLQSPSLHFRSPLRILCHFIDTPGANIWDEPRKVSTTRHLGNSFQGVLPLFRLRDTL